MYNSINELPTEVRNSFTLDDANSWMRAYNAHYEEWQRGDITVPPEYVTPETYIRSLAWMDCRYLESSRFVEPVVTTEVVDKQMELAPVDEYLKAAYDALEKGGVGIGAHSNKVCFVMWDAFKTEDPKTGAPAIAVRINFFRDTLLYDREWEMFLDGRREWSIGSYTQDVIDCDSGRCHTRIMPLQWFELSNVKEGVNPRTYVREFNEKAKGEMVMRDFHEDECPIKKAYREFKERITEITKGMGSIEMMEGGIGVMHGKGLDEASEEAHQRFPQYDFHKIEMEDTDEEFVVMVPRPIDTIDEVLHSMVHLIMDEQEAIEGYNMVQEGLIEGTWATEEELSKIAEMFEEVKTDEKNHIGVILKAIQVLAPDTYSSILDGMSEAGDAERIKGVECPAGQHSHPGVKGCHDVFRKHDFHHSNAPSDKLDLTDEDIDVQSIEEMPTERLKEIVTKIAGVLARYDNEEVSNFLSTTSGKEFVLMFLELKKRKHEKTEVKEMTDETVEVSEKEAGCKGEPEQTDENTAVKEAEKGTDAPDILTLINSLTAAVASLAPVVDSINARLIKIEQAMVVETTEDAPQISEEIMEAVEDTAPEVTTEDSVTSETIEEKMGEDEEESKEEVEEKEETEEEKSDSEAESEEEAKDEPPAEEKEESKTEEKEEEKTEEKSEEEPSDGPEEKEETESKTEETESKEEEKKDEDEPKEGKKGETEEEEVKEEAKGESEETESKEEEPKEEESEKSTLPPVPAKEAAMIEEASKGVMSLDDYLDSTCKELGIGVYAKPCVSLADMPAASKESTKGDIQVIMPQDVPTFDGRLTDSSKSEDPYAMLGQVTPSEYMNKILRRE